MRRALLLCLALVSCSSRSNVPEQGPVTLAADDVRALLRAGISVSAAAKDLSVSKAADLANSPGTRSKIDATLARAVHAECARSAQVPINETELAQLTQLHWRDVDVDKRVKVVHVVALRKKFSEQDARRLLESLREELKAATDLATFERLTRPRVSESKGALVQESLDTFTTDGRTTEGPPSSFDADFVRGAFALTSSDPLSPIVPSSYGWHIIFLLAAKPPHRLPPDERRALFTPEAQTNRARACIVALVTKLRSSHPPVFGAGSTAEIERIQQPR